MTVEYTQAVEAEAEAIAADLIAEHHPHLKNVRQFVEVAQLLIAFDVPAWEHENGDQP